MLATERGILFWDPRTKTEGKPELKVVGNLEYYLGFEKKTNPKKRHFAIKIR